MQKKCITYCVNQFKRTIKQEPKCKKYLNVPYLKILKGVNIVNAENYQFFFHIAKNEAIGIIKSYKSLLRLCFTMILLQQANLKSFKVLYSIPSLYVYLECMYIFSRYMLLIG